MSRLAAFLGRPRLRRRLLLGGLLIAILWVGFLDSHSLLKRLQYLRERAVLTQEVTQLREANEALEARLRQGLSDEVVEEIAREQYGMRKAGETVYLVEE